jgi:RNA polymerase sigma-70 factor (ECF subfamily)
VDGTLWSALSALSADDRELLNMRAWDELAVGEIATILGCTANAASGRLHKARIRLAEELRRYECEEAELEVGAANSTGKENR